jgi:hypothetical protein
MREQSTNHSDPIPNAENWILVSDPFERPKVYRHKNAILRVDESPEDEIGLFVYVLQETNQAPLILNNIDRLRMDDDIFKGNYFSLYAPPVLRLIINNDPVEIGNAFPVYTEGNEGFVFIPDFFKRSAEIKHLEKLSNLKEDTYFRFKIEARINPNYQRDNPPTFRGTLNADATLALKQAVALYDYFQGIP